MSTYIQKYTQWRILQFWRNLATEFTILADLVVVTNVCEISSNYQTCELAQHIEASLVEGFDDLRKFCQIA